MDRSASKGGDRLTGPSSRSDPPVDRSAVASTAARPRPKTAEAAIPSTAKPRLGSTRRPSESVIRPDSTDERLLTASFLDEGPTWAPNGRVIMFTRETAGAAGSATLYSVDVSGRNLHQVPTPSSASDPAWSPLLP
ncbi:MAG: hypothetical protein B7Y02_02345 [Rhodobacterales bacterium 17-64-5]|nr:MAG: hypothetical protein B7Y02_02345 [Rhodobacterales bacterium 17-64-5]